MFLCSKFLAQLFGLCGYLFLLVARYLDLSFHCVELVLLVLLLGPAFPIELSHLFVVLVESISTILLISLHHLLQLGPLSP